MPVEASVLTLVRGRSVQLRHLMQGLAAQTVRPRDLVIAWMQPEPEADLPDPGCPVRHIHVPGEKLPLAAARNRAAEAARTELLVFLDVDCVPGPGLLAAYAEAAAATDGLFLGEVLYLPPGAIPSAGIHFANLDRLGRNPPRETRHSRSRPAPRARPGPAVGLILRAAGRRMGRGGGHGRDLRRLWR